MKWPFWAKGFLGQGQGMRVFGHLNYWLGGNSRSGHQVSWVDQAWGTPGNMRHHPSSHKRQNLCDKPFQDGPMSDHGQNPDSQTPWTHRDDVVHHQFSGEETKAERAVTCSRPHGLGELGSLVSCSPSWLLTTCFHQKGKEASRKGIPFSCPNMGACAL